MEIKQSKRGGSRKGAGRKPKKSDAITVTTKAPVDPESRTERGTFKPGHSGNPGGTPKGASDVRALARSYTKRAVERLAEWMESDNAKASVSASVSLLNRGWGMPQQSLKATVTHLRSMTDDELIGYITGTDEEGGGDGALEAPGSSQVTH